MGRCTPVLLQVISAPAVCSSPLKEGVPPLCCSFSNHTLSFDLICFIPVCPMLLSHFPFLPAPLLPRREGCPAQGGSEVSKQPPPQAGKREDSRGKEVAPLLGIRPGEPRSAPLPSLLLSNLILPCFIAGPLSSVMGKSFQCPGSLLQRQRGRGCSF